ncbi:DNA ligase 4 [Seminavis robusta]|uniref:DNA ligase 4 n=1 Tax=Seminavis robusta TaxID=568900 RepID=A0A9N8DEV1_9STRA|nr:DNA ligase 4 [Seminavis robusta]|eukprot:Sro61_g035070.1 DNA ligase 4 (1399) ;mRNA; f:82396-87269
MNYGSDDDDYSFAKKFMPTSSEHVDGGPSDLLDGLSKENDKDEEINNDGEDAKKEDNVGSDEDAMLQDPDDDDNKSIESAPDPDITGLTKEPSYDFANKQDFRMLCKRLEYLDLAMKNKHKKPMTKVQKLEMLLPSKSMKKMKNESLFPIFRLLMPNMDSSRKCITKEKSIAMAYCEALNFQKKSDKYEALYYYTDPIKLEKAKKGWGQLAGDLSRVVEAVMDDRVKAGQKTVTIGKINQLFDDLEASLTGMKDGAFNSRNPDNWRGASQSQSQSLATTQARKDKLSQKTVRTKFVKKLMELKISAREHKWIVRMLLEHIKVGLGFETIIGWFSDHAEDIWKSHNSLKSVCDKLSDPEWVAKREIELERAKEAQKKERFARIYNYPSSLDPVRIGSIISCMKSERTSLEGCLAQIGTVHAAVLANKKTLPKDDPARESLAIKFPAFVAEEKLDGERMIVHVHRGKVTMHTRSGNLYSRVYSPVLGPHLRKAVAKYDIDVILDGEVLAWDSKSEAVIEFGNNRTVAKLRRKWMESQGQVDERDLGLHEGEKEAKVMKPEYFKQFDKEEDDTEGGDEVWLKFTAFDVVYIGGPGAEECLKNGLRPYLEADESVEAGSIIHLSLFERKALLYHLMTEQKDFCDIVASWVIRPNGDSVEANDYFTTQLNDQLERGHAKCVLDSSKWTLNSGNWSPQFDTKRRQGRTDAQISRRRTELVDMYYNEIVEEKKGEGLVFKDLSSPYVLRGTAKTKLWLKMKPDYTTQNFISDIDVVVIGGTWAIGQRRSGYLSSFLCACVDSESHNREKYFTFCRINARSLDEKKLDEVMRYTGFQRRTGDKPTELGKWFKEEEHGTTLPDFISQRSFQDDPEGDNGGWRFSKNTDFYPDVFIKPEDSVIVTVKAGEIVGSDEYSAGLTLRFPRASGVRMGDKPSADCVDENELMQMKRQVDEQKSAYRATAGSSQSIMMTSPSKKMERDAEAGRVSRFWTAERYIRSKKTRKPKISRKALRRVKTVAGEEISEALDGLKFFVLAGEYSLDLTGLDAEQAKSEGWYDIAKDVRSASDVESFIYSHGGSLVNGHDLDVYAIASSADDLKVHTTIKGYDAKKEKVLKKQKVTKDNSTTIDIGVPGVLKWTHVFSLVFRWVKEMEALKEQGLSQEELDVQDEQIRKRLAEPRFFDYVSQSEMYGTATNALIWRHGDMDTSLMERALACLEQSAQPPKKRVRRTPDTAESTKAPWQQTAMKQLSANERWIMKLQYETLWPYSVDENGSANGEPKQPVIVYPDFFGDDFGLSDVPPFTEDKDRRSKASREMMNGSAGSKIPLLRAMGAMVSWNLHSSVTHILCDLACGVGSISWSPDLVGGLSDGLGDKQHERKLLARLEATMDHSVLLVSDEWVDAQWE